MGVDKSPDQPGARDAINLGAVACHPNCAALFIKRREFFDRHEWFPGIPPAKILKCWTTEVARLLEIDDERGAIEEGQMADVIATPSNPLTDIQTLRDVHFVMKNGRVIRHDP